MAYKSNRNLCKFIFNAKGSHKILDNSGMYELVCPTCNKEYIGQTSMRVKENIRSYDQKKEDSTFSNTFLTMWIFASTTRRYDSPTYMRKGNKLTQLEALEIYKLNKILNKILNEHIYY